MSRYIRTEDYVYDKKDGRRYAENFNDTLAVKLPDGWVNLGKVIKRSNHIEDLVDTLTYKHDMVDFDSRRGKDPFGNPRHYLRLYIPLHNEDDLFMSYEILHSNWDAEKLLKEGNVCGCIWVKLPNNTERLEPVAQLTEKGELESILRPMEEIKFKFGLRKDA